MYIHDISCGSATTPEERRVKIEGVPWRFLSEFIKREKFRTMMTCNAMTTAVTMMTAKIATSGTLSTTGT